MKSKTKNYQRIRPEDANDDEEEKFQDAVVVLVGDEDGENDDLSNGRVESTPLSSSPRPQQQRGEEMMDSSNGGGAPNLPSSLSMTEHAEKNIPPTVPSSSSLFTKLKMMAKKPLQSLPTTTGRKPGSASNSVASYQSLIEQQEGIDNDPAGVGPDTYNQMRDDTALDGGEEMDLSLRTGERSPLRGSYDEEDIDVGGSSSNNSTPQRNQLYMNFSLESDGVDDEDDEFDDEAHLRRYHLDFSLHSTDPNTLAMMEPPQHSSSHVPSSSFTNTWMLRHVSSMPSYLWFSLQSVRQQARQRRAALLLQHTERNWQQNLKIVLLTYCDATDGGILLVAAFMVFWLFLLYLSSFQATGLWVFGVVLLTLRFGTRPMYTKCQHERQKRRHQKQQQQLEQEQQEQELSNGESYLPRLRPRLGSRNLLREDVLMLDTIELQSMDSSGGASSTATPTNGSGTATPRSGSATPTNNATLSSPMNISPKFAGTTADPVIHTI